MIISSKCLLRVFFFPAFSINNCNSLDNLFWGRSKIFMSVFGGANANIIWKESQSTINACLIDYQPNYIIDTFGWVCG